MMVTIVEETSAPNHLCIHLMTEIQGGAVWLDS